MDKKKDFDFLSPQEERVLAEIMEFDRPILFNFRSIVYHSIKHLEECSDDIDDCLIDIPFMGFLHWAMEKLDDNTLYQLYPGQIDVFEKMINEDIQTEDIRSVQGIPGLLMSLSGDDSMHNDLSTPLSGAELKFEERLTKLYETSSDFISLFINMNNYKDLSWDEFEKLL